LNFDKMSLQFEDVLMLLDGRRVAKGRLTVEGGRIAAIDAQEVDCSRPIRANRLIMPGLVNAHGHSAMTLVRGLGGGLPLQRWLEEAIFPVEAKMTYGDIRAGALWGAMEMLAGGTVCVADMYDFPGAGGDAFREAGIKANICRVGLNFVEGRLDDCVGFTNNWHNDKVVADICIHSEYLTDEGFCRALAAANREFKRPLHVHVSETKREHDECIERHGKTPIAYLADTGLLDYGAYAAHCVWCTDEDFEIMREKGVTLVHNPTSNLKLGSGFARIPEAIAAGVSVALGTDGCASNNNLDMFEEMHLSSLIHKGRLNDPTALSAWDVIEMATVNGARALGRSNCAELAVGNAADLCVVDLDKPHLSPVTDVAELVVGSMQASDVVMTMVDGEVLYDRGQWPTINDERAEYDFKRAVRRLLK
jgi:5-methylthioadenosine/S-adenosylhomocysteine deaminase